jgi:hypothetical protein
VELLNYLHLTAIKAKEKKRIQKLSYQKMKITFQGRLEAQKLFTIIPLNINDEYPRTKF